MPPSMHMVSIILKVEHWNICLSMCTDTPASFHADSFNVFESEAFEYMFDACALTAMSPFMQKVSMVFSFCCAAGYLCQDAICVHCIPVCFTDKTVCCSCAWGVYKRLSFFREHTKWHQCCCGGYSQVLSRTLVFHK